MCQDDLHGYWTSSNITGAAYSVIFTKVHILHFRKKHHFEINKFWNIKQQWLNKIAFDAMVSVNQSDVTITASFFLDATTLSVHHYAPERL